MQSGKHWLDRFRDDFHGRVLELGCGTGIDTGWLMETRCNLVSTDLSIERIVQNKSTYRGSYLQLDHTRALPFADSTFDAVVAGLSLHYFDWGTTTALVREIARVLVPDGTFLGRFNSSNDFEFGAGTGVEIEPGLFRLTRDGGSRLKRFFSDEDVERLFTFWTIRHLQEMTFDYGGKMKVAWELCANNQSANRDTLHGHDQVS